MEEMASWLTVDDVDHEAVSALLIEMDTFMKGVSMMPKQLRFFKQNRFLTSLKQRFLMPLARVTLIFRNIIFGLRDR